MVRMRTLLGYERDFALYRAQGNDAPRQVQTRVLEVAARAARSLS